MSKAGSGGRALRVIHLAVAALIIGTDHVHGGGTTTMETKDLGLFSIRAVVVKRFQANNSKAGRWHNKSLKRLFIGSKRCITSAKFQLGIISSGSAFQRSFLRWFFQ